MPTPLVEKRYRVHMANHDGIVKAAPIPVTVLAGFLGSGKTTLLNRILNGDHGLRVAVLVNDFGSINIDAELIVGAQSDVISLANGCVCCSIREDLVEAVISVMTRLERPEYILLEASGVAEPSEIALTFVNASFRDQIRLDSITCVVDAEQVFSAPETTELKIHQIAFSDMVILNKVDLVDRTQIEKIKAWLDDRIHRYRLIEAIRCEVPLEILLAVGRFDPVNVRLNRPLTQGGPSDRFDREDNQEHSSKFRTWTFQTNHPLSLEALRKVASQLPVNIYRAKGVVYCTDAPLRRAVLQVVGKRVDLALEDHWGDRLPLTRIVTIGAPGGVDADLLLGKFLECLGPAPWVNE